MLCNCPPSCFCGFPWCGNSWLLWRCGVLIDQFECFLCWSIMLFYWVSSIQRRNSFARIVLVLDLGLVVCILVCWNCKFCTCAMTTPCSCQVAICLYGGLRWTILHVDALELQWIFLWLGFLSLLWGLVFSWMLIWQSDKNNTTLDLLTHMAPPLFECSWHIFLSLNFLLFLYLLCKWREKQTGTSALTVIMMICLWESLSCPFLHLFIHLLIMTSIADDAFFDARIIRLQCDDLQNCHYLWGNCCSFWIHTTLEKCIVQRPKFYFMESLLEFILVFDLNICFCELVWTRHLKSQTALGIEYAYCWEIELLQLALFLHCRTFHGFFRFHLTFFKPDDCFQKNGDLKGAYSSKPSPQTGWAPKGPLMKWAVPLV